MNQKENNLLWLGTIVNTHGVKGEVRVLSNSDEPEIRFKPGSVIKYFDNDTLKELTIKTMRFHKKFILLTFENINGINDIEWIKSYKVYTDKEELKDGRYYLEDVIDKEVYDQDNNVIGIVTEVYDQGPYESLVVKLENGNTTNIPMIDEFKFNYDGTKVSVKIPKEFIN